MDVVKQEPSSGDEELVSCGMSNDQESEIIDTDISNVKISFTSTLMLSRTTKQQLIKDNMPPNVACPGLGGDVNNRLINSVRKSSASIKQEPQSDGYPDGTLVEVSGEIDVNVKSEPTDIYPCGSDSRCNESGHSSESELHHEVNEGRLMDKIKINLLFKCDE